MEGIQNYMEILVEREVEGVLKSVGVCDCTKCKQDVCALALNQLKPHYVVSEKGKVLIKLRTMDVQYRTDVLAALTYGATIVSKNIKHDYD